MTRVNDEFMEAFKRLDILCKDMFQAEKGVTTYINTMESIPNGATFVPTWNATFQRLKKLRHIRNNLSHEIGTSYTDVCSPEDIAWLKQFYTSILNTTDPLAMYRKATIQRRNMNTSAPRPVKFTINNNNNNNSKNNNDNQTQISYTEAFIVLVILLVILFISMLRMIV